jgi:GAF domain-containing protein
MPHDYDLLVSQARALLGEEPDAIANAANFSAFVFHELSGVNWAGFYFAAARGGLVLGPFSGRPACTRLPRGRGVCARAFETARTVVVDDVAAFDGHIACDARSRSEIVVPLVANGAVRGVFDVDSPVIGRFSGEDVRGIEALVGAFVNHAYARGAPA